MGARASDVDGLTFLGNFHSFHFLGSFGLVVFESKDKSITSNTFVKMADRQAKAADTRL